MKNHRVSPFALLLVASQLGSTTSVHSTAPGMRGNVVDTVSSVVQADLDILDTIHLPSRLAERPAEPSTFWLGGDTIVETRVSLYPIPGQRTAATRAEPKGGMAIQIEALARDTTVGFLHQYPAAFAHCPLELQLFKTPARTGRPAWTSMPSNDTLACANLKSSADFARSTEWPVQEILGDSLPAGRYFFTVTLRLADGRKFIATDDAGYLTGISAPPIDDLSAVRFHGSSVVGGLGPRMLRTRVAAINTSNRLVQMYYGSCALMVALFSVAHPSAIPAWRSADRGPRERPNVRHFLYACTADLRGRVIAPSDSDVFELVVPLAEILADTLPFGRYRVTASLALGNQNPRVAGATRRLDLGEISILAAPDSLPRSRIVNGLRYTAAAQIFGGRNSADSVRTMVLVTNPSRGRISEEFSTICPVVAYAYKSTAERDSLPLGRPAWSATTGCPFVSRRFALGPGQRQLFYIDRPMRDQGIEQGRYFIVAWFGGKVNALLNAGSVNIGHD